jgi:hypothetical protein
LKSYLNHRPPARKTAVVRNLVVAHAAAGYFNNHSGRSPIYRLCAFLHRLAINKKMVYLAKIPKKSFDSGHPQIL